jgi:transcriptional regulator with XRE-family HTH domain
MTRWGRNLERLRKARNLSKVAFAHAVGMTPQQLGDLVNSTDNPKVSTLQRIADALRVDISEIFRSPSEGDTALAHGTTQSPAHTETRPVFTFDNDNAIRLVVANTLATIAARLSEEIMRSQADAGAGDPLRRPATGHWATSYRYWR